MRNVSFFLFDNFLMTPYNFSAMLESLKGYISPGSEEEKVVEKIDFNRLPLHIAIIMDGNGRWAKMRNLPRIEGHRAGTKSVQEAVETAARAGIKYLTLFAFSNENWKRPPREVRTLWRLLEDYLKKQDKDFQENRLRLKVIGRKERIPPSVRKELERVEEITRDFDRMTVILALNYGGRSEIVDACQNILRSENISPEKLDEKSFTHFLYTGEIPDPDLLIRTSGEMRISNFLLWQIAYSEIWITDVLWPDFRRIHMLQAILEYQKRERRFGGLENSRRERE